MKRMLHVDRVDSLQTEKVRIVADGLQPSRCYKFRLKMYDKYGLYASNCVVQSSSLGCVDLARDAPIRGSYHGVDPMGLFLTLQPTPNVRFGHLMAPPITRPSYYTLQLFNESECLVDEVHLKKHWNHPMVSRIEVNEEEIGLYGVLFKPPGPGPFPCILDIPGAHGGVSEPSSACLASEGFVVFTFAYFLQKDLPRKISGVDVSFFDKPIRFVESLPYFSGKLGVYGLCFGATIANFLAIRYPQISAVVSVNCLESFCEDELVFLENGERMKWGHVDEGMSRFVNGVINQTPVYGSLYNNLSEDERIPFKKASKRTAFRIVGGSDDWVTCSVGTSKRIQRELLGAGIHVEMELLASGHLLMPPYFPHHSINYNKFVGMNWGQGGECVVHSKSQEMTWQRHVDFFRRHLGSPPEVPDWNRMSLIELPPDSRENSSSKL